jgi:cell division protease FtsH
MNNKKEKNNEVGPDKKKNQRPGNYNLRRFVTFFLLGFWVVYIIGLFAPQPSIGNKVNISVINQLITDGKVKKATLDDNNALITIMTSSGKKYYAIYPTLWGRDLTNNLTADKNIDLSVIPIKKGSFLSALFMNILPILIMIGFLMYFTRKSGNPLGGFMGRFGKKSDPVEVPKVRFTDVAGIDEVVSELKEVVDFLHDPEKFKSTGATPSRGFLLIGEPGTGKTLLAKAVAGEAGVPFFNVSGSDFVEIFAGMGASRVRDLFGKARAAERAILFIDEIDAIGKARASGGFSGANDEREQTLNQILVELDGFVESNVIILAATNRADILDPALTRPGRFDRKIVVPAPDRKGRETIMKLHAKNHPFSEEINWEDFAKRTPGLTGADISLIINESALEASRAGRDVILSKDIDSALATTVLGRERKSAIITDRDREIVAYHEAGHAICAYMLDDAPKPAVISIVPRGGTGGVTWMTGSEDDFMTRKQALARLVVSMGGRASEEILLKGDFTHGAHGDIDSATNLAKVMVTRYGMGKNIIALEEGYLGPNEVVNQEIASLIKDSLVEARKVLAKNKQLLLKLASTLLEEETIDLKRMEEVVNGRKIKKSTSNVKPATKSSVKPSNKSSVKPSNKSSVKPASKSNVKPASKNNVKPASKDNV